MDTCYNVTYRTYHLLIVGSPQGLMPIGLSNSQSLQSATTFLPRVFSFPHGFRPVLGGQPLPATRRISGIPWPRPGPFEVDLWTPLLQGKPVLDMVHRTIIVYSTFSLTMRLPGELLNLLQFELCGSQLCPVELKVLGQVFVLVPQGLYNITSTYSIRSLTWPSCPS